AGEGGTGGQEVNPKSEARNPKQTRIPNEPNRSGVRLSCFGFVSDFDIRTSDFPVNGIRESVRQMKGYTPGEQLNDPDVIKLNTNENPYPPSPRIFEAIRATLTGDKLRKYPQPLGDDFRKAAGRVLGVDPDSILIGNGSDDILTILTRAF